jgi:hypothetical protein
LGRREESVPLSDDLGVRKATERAEMMATGELLTWVESISSTIAVQVGSYAAHQIDDTQLHEARRQAEVLHALLTVLLSRS